MGRSKNIYKPLRNRHGEGRRRYTTIGLNDEVAAELKLVVKAYSEVYGRMTPAQVIKRLIDAGLKRCDPEVFDAFIRLTECGTPEPVLEIVHQVDPTEGEVWDRKYFFEKDGEQVDAKINVKGDSFSAKIGNRFYGVKELRRKEWVFMNDRRVEITEEQARVIAQKIVQHKVDMYYKHAAEAVRAKEKEWNEEYDKIEKLRSEQQES